jgi:alcohol dehydrogenase (cytochrome c)
MSWPTLKLSSSSKLLVLLLFAAVASAGAQNSGAGSSLAPVGKEWATYNGEPSGRRFSALTQINRDNVRHLQLVWAFPTHGRPIKGAPIEVDGIVYVTVPEKVWAIDAKTGDLIWSFSRPSEGDHLAQRGVGYYKGRVYFGTPDAHLISLDARNGRKIWEVTVADVKFGYYLSLAPLIIDGKVIVGTSGDEADIPHFIAAYDWETGRLLWKQSVLPDWNTPEGKTWPNPQALSHGGGAPWLTGTYDPALHLMYWGTGNPHPVVDGQGRAGDNLYTCSILAMNPDTGKIAWYFQPSPHDVHDWDAVETPVLFDAPFRGRARKLLAQASRNGYFFLLDRETGEHLLTVPFVNTNWASGIDAQGRPVADPALQPSPDGSLIQGTANGGTNWMPPSFDPQTNLFYVQAREGDSFWYLALENGKDAADHQGGGSVNLTSTSTLEAIDYRTGKIRWRWPSGEGVSAQGILTTAGHLLFTGDLSGNLLALDPVDGRALWHVRLGGNLSGAPMTYEVDGRQYVLMAVNDLLYAWSISNPQK